MSKMITKQNTIDPVTGIPVINGLSMMTLTGVQMVTQPTGESPGGYNTLPGTSVSVPSSIGGNPGLPYKFTEVPSTGTLIVNGRTIGT